MPNLDLYPFPRRFLWGTAIAAQQVEHHSPSDWIQFENLATADVRDYFHWTLTDNFEWARGFEARFGLMRLNYQDGFRRVPRPSAEIYAELARHNALREQSDHVNTHRTRT